MEYWRKVKFITFPEIERIMRLTKWVRLYQNPNYKPPTPKQLEKRKIREQKNLLFIFQSFCFF